MNTNKNSRSRFILFLSVLCVQPDKKISPLGNRQEWSERGATMSIVNRHQKPVLPRQDQEYGFYFRPFDRKRSNPPRMRPPLLPPYSHRTLPALSFARSLTLYSPLLPASQGATTTPDQRQQWHHHTCHA